MRSPLSVLAALVASSLALACSSERSTLADDHQAGDGVAISSSSKPASSGALTEPDPSELPAPPTASSAVGSDSPTPTEQPSEVAEAPAADAPAPTLPSGPGSGPAPGSPEADAELAELLDESTLTQEEFDNAFRGGGPKIEGDQFVFGPNERPRGRPLVDVGTPTVTGSSVSPSTLVDLARGSQRDLEGCYALALGKDPSVAGAVTLVLRFDAHGDVSGAKVEGASPLGAGLDQCLVSVADAWRVRAAAGATVRMTLRLSTTAGM